MYFRVDDAVFEKLPNAFFGVVAVSGIDNSAEIPALGKLLEETAGSCAQDLQSAECKVKENPAVVPYREAFRALGINPGRYACSIEALLDRISKGKGMPSVNPAVDLGNVISLRYKLPIGAHDINSFVGAEAPAERSCGDAACVSANCNGCFAAADNSGAGLEVRPAVPEDIFIPFGGTEADAETPPEGEVVYVSGNEVRTRRWTWRQGEPGKITESTTAVLYPVDGFSDINAEEVKAAVKDIVALVMEAFGKTSSGISVTSGFVDRNHPQFDF